MTSIAHRTRVRTPSDCLVGVCAVAAIVWLPAVAPASEADSKEQAAQRLVQAALQAEIKGDEAQYAARLSQALRLAPDYAPARWHSGQILVDQQWLAVPDAQQQAAASELIQRYRRLRAAYGETPAGQLALARWCQSKRLSEEARFHWASVLAIQPDHPEALRALDLRWVDGRLMTPNGVKQWKENQRQRRRAAQQWQPEIARWKRALSGHDDSLRNDARDEIRSITNPLAIGPLEEATLSPQRSGISGDDCNHNMAMAFVEALRAMSDQAATNSLVRHAVLAPWEDVRTASAAGLRDRSKHDYIPLLLSGLAMPVETYFSVTTTPDGSVHYGHSLYREGPHADWALERGQRVWQYDLGGRVILPTSSRNVGLAPRVPNSDFLAAAKKSRVARGYQVRFANQATALEQQVTLQNGRTAALNGRITQVLRQVTGEDYPADARAWWNWWAEYNEYESTYDRPVYDHHYSDATHYYHQPPRLVGGMSCFARGTLVWTKTGQRPIETLKLGDLVLSQDVDTGELAYQPVIRRTLRPPSPMIKLHVGQTPLYATLGHPFWVSGTGWQMAKKLQTGDILHGVSGPSSVANYEPAAEFDAYNLVVAQFNTYFVGETGLLVHDNTPRKPTTALVPGWPR